MPCHNRHVEDLLDPAVNAKPFGAHTPGQVDDLDTAPRLAVGVDEPLIKRKPLKALVARPRQANERKAPRG